MKEYHTDPFALVNFTTFLATCELGATMALSADK